MDMKTTRNPIRKSTTFVKLTKASGFVGTYRLDGTTNITLRCFDGIDVPRIPADRWETNQAIIEAAQKHFSECMAMDMPFGTIGMGR